jgi:hypothetical protein
MTRVLSLTACCRLAERVVREARGDLPREPLLARLTAFDIDEERAAAGARLATIVGRLRAATDDEGVERLFADRDRRVSITGAKS